MKFLLQLILRKKSFQFDLLTLVLIPNNKIMNQDHKLKLQVESIKDFILSKNKDYPLKHFHQFMALIEKELWLRHRPLKRILLALRKISAFSDPILKQSVNKLFSLLFELQKGEEQKLADRNWSNIRSDECCPRKKWSRCPEKCNLIDKSMCIQCSETYGSEAVPRHNHIITLEERQINCQQISIDAQHAIKGEKPEFCSEILAKIVMALSTGPNVFVWPCLQDGTIQERQRKVPITLINNLKTCIKYFLLNRDPNSEHAEITIRVKKCGKNSSQQVMVMKVVNKTHRLYAYPHKRDEIDVIDEHDNLLYNIKRKYSSVDCQGKRMPIACFYQALMEQDRAARKMCKNCFQFCPVSIQSSTVGGALEAELRMRLFQFPNLQLIKLEGFYDLPVKKQEAECWKILINVKAAILEQLNAKSIFYTVKYTNNKKRKHLFVFSCSSDCTHKYFMLLKESLRQQRQNNDFGFQIIQPTRVLQIRGNWKGEELHGELLRQASNNTTLVNFVNTEKALKAYVCLHQKFGVSFQ